MSENTNNLKYEDSKFSIENAILDKVEGAIDSSTGEKAITLDSNLKLLGSLDISGATYSLCQSPEWIKVLVDSQDRIIAGVRTDGSVYINKIEGVTDAIQEIREALGVLEEKVEQGKQVITITCKRNGVSGVDADFCGLNAIGDAISSIKDASPSKIYNIIIDGYFLFTNPKMIADGGDFKYVEDGEPSAVFTRKFINIIGVDNKKAVVEVNLPEGLQETDFPYSSFYGRYLTYRDYQPLYIQKGASVSNITFIGRNCRYVSHIEVGENDEGCTIEINNCNFLEKKKGQSITYNMGTMVIGEIPHFKLYIKDSTFLNEDGGHLFFGHTPLSNVDVDTENCKVKFENCDFIGKGDVGLTTYEYNREDLMSFVNCRFSPQVELRAFAHDNSKRQIGTIIDMKIDNHPLPYVIQYYAFVLRVSTTTGLGTSVRFDPSSTAFAIIGNAGEETATPLKNGATRQYGYEYRDDADGSHAFACGLININPTTGNSLGSILGDCSVTNKYLKIIINDVEYNVVFNANYTSASNEDIISVINAVIGSVANCDTYGVESEKYPDFKDIEYNVVNDDTELIRRGMGVIKTSINTIRRAKRNDGHIDGIVLDDIYPSQKGRIITNGMLFNENNNLGYMLWYYSIYPYISNLSFGDKLSISSTNDGEFVKSDDTPVLIAIGNNVVKIK